MTRPDAELPRALAVLLPALWATAAFCAERQSASEPADQVLDEVLVLGEQPGPAMWKVSRDGHTHVGHGHDDTAAATA